MRRNNPGAPEKNENNVKKPCILFYILTLFNAKKKKGFPQIHKAYYYCLNL